ncbi:serine/threonine-protein kinase D6PKL2-like protein [Tanacetum coccineum]
MFEREKLSGNNFNDWFRQLKLVLRVEKKMYVIEQPLPAAPAADSEAQVLSQWNAVYDAYNEVACLILGSMTPELHRQFENSSPYDMIKELKSMFEKQAGVERFDLIQTFHACKQEEGKPVAAYVLQMKGYVDQLERLGYMLPQDLIVGLILNGLTKDFAGFVRNYNMHNMGKTIGELHAMLIEYEKGLPKKAETPQVMMIKGGKIQKANKKSLKAKGKGKANGKGKDKQMNCPVYLAELLKKKKQVGSASSSDNCHYAPSITRGVVSIHRLVENGFVQCFTDYGISVSKNNVFYFNAIPSNGIYEIDMYDLVPNDNSIYNISTKRAKHNLDSTYLWYCRLAHISKKRIEKLQQEGLLKSTDDESFDQYVSCLLGKMTRKSFLHRPERATGLLGIIHINVCGPLKHVSRQDASYFITFIDVYSRYGYVYILKHKHEVFETFKVFKNEVENQLGKIIKALRSDRGGEYISQEFKDYLKACRIVQQLTPPYTPQHNGVSERRNHTLLDMVRSMMNLTTLSLFFWDYALEFATCILNMVPTKKALVKRDTPGKPQQRSVKCIFIGYPKKTMGYYFYFPPKNKIVVARYAEFFEKNLITQEVSGRAIDLKEIQNEDKSPSEITSEIPMEVKGFEPPQEEVIPVCRSERTHRAPDRLCLNVEAEEHSLGDLNEPTSYKATVLDPESNKWIDAMNAEIQSMMDNMVWVLVDLPPNCKTVRKTFSPVADIRAIRILISIAAYYDYEIWKMDVKTAFLNGYLDEDIYMASRSWNKRFDEEIKRFGFDQNLDEPCVYQKASGSNVTFLILYVDDIIIMGNHIPSLQSVIKFILDSVLLWNRFRGMEAKAAFILGIKIYRDRSKRLIGLGQNAYMDKILKRYKMDNSKHGHIPMQERLDLNNTQGASTPKKGKRYVFVLNGSAVDWKSSKQSTTAMSATEAEYIAASEAAMEAVWIRKFISGLGIIPTINEPIRMFCDNSAALYFANDPGVQKGARHYHRRYHYVRESIALGEIRFLKVHTDDNLADPFTKALSKTKLSKHARSMGLRLASGFM